MFKSSKIHTQVFGTSLSKTAYSVPVLLKDCFDYFRKNPESLEAEGLFRLSGRISVINKIKSDYDKGVRVLLDDIDPHCVAGLIKLYFRELAEPLLTFELYDLFVAAHSINVEESRSQMISKLLLELPPGHRIVLFQLIKFLSDVASKSASNKMTASNLSIVFGPNILIHRDMTVAIALQETPAVTGITETLIEEYPTIFPEEYLPKDIEVHKSGWLSKKGKYGNKWRDRWVVLNGTRKTFTYYGSKPADGTNPTPLGVIQMETCVICPHLEKEFSFKIISPRKSYFFLCRDKQEFEDWQNSVIATSALHNMDGIQSIPGNRSAKLAKPQARGSWYLPKNGEIPDEKDIQEDDSSESDDEDQVQSVSNSEEVFSSKSSTSRKTLKPVDSNKSKTITTPSTDSNRRSKTVSSREKANGIDRISKTFTSRDTQKSSRINKSSKQPTRNVRASTHKRPTASKVSTSKSPVLSKTSLTSTYVPKSSLNSPNYNLEKSKNRLSPAIKPAMPRADPVEKPSDVRPPPPRGSIRVNRTPLKKRNLQTASKKSRTQFFTR